MSGNNTQIGYTPSGPLLENNETESHTAQLLVAPVVTINQPVVPLTTANMIPSQNYPIVNLQQNNNTTRRQQSRRRRRQRQRQRRREHQGTVTSQQRFQRQQANDRAFNRWLDNQHEYYQRRIDRYNDMWEYEDPFEEPMEETFKQRLLEAYDLETMDPKERWEQEQVYELEGFAVLEQLAQIHDETEQQNRIDAEQQFIKEEKQRRNNEELIQHEQWEQVEFLLQQLKEH
jgi:hypothetical protein